MGCGSSQVSERVSLVANIEKFLVKWPNLHNVVHLEGGERSKPQGFWEDNVEVLGLHLLSLYHRMAAYYFLVSLCNLSWGQAFIILSTSNKWRLGVKYQRSSDLMVGYLEWMLPLVQQLKQFHALFHQNRQCSHHLMQTINLLGKGHLVSLEDILGCG